MMFPRPKKVAYHRKTTISDSKISKDVLTTGACKALRSIAGTDRARWQIFNHECTRTYTNKGKEVSTADYADLHDLGKFP